MPQTHRLAAAMAVLPVKPGCIHCRTKNTAVQAQDSCAIGWADIPKCKNRSSDLEHLGSGVVCHGLTFLSLPLMGQGHHALLQA
ncbi:MAG TPA: hypothetical protein PKY40_12975, partial [Burkholderiaceae bacterium]|nr:hypothetical protein [Burkholderiaceae bacterium]